jgi:hypothetical protein
MGHHIMAYMRKYPQALENVPNRAETCTDESVRQELTHGLSSDFLDCVEGAEGSMKMVAGLRFASRAAGRWLSGAA